MVPYVVLSQILPISFTACLFIIQLHLDAMGLSPSSSPPPKAKASSDSKTAGEKKKPEPGFKKSSLTLPTIILNAVVLALPAMKGSQIFIPMVLFTRLMLLVPHTGRTRFSQNDVLQSVSISFGFVVAALTMLRGSTTFRETIAGVGNGGYAVKTLGYDAELALLVCAVLKWGGGV